MLSKVVKARETDWPLKDLKEVISRQKGQGKSKSPEMRHLWPMAIIALLKLSP